MPYCPVHKSSFSGNQCPACWEDEALTETWVPLTQRKRKNKKPVVTHVTGGSKPSPMGGVTVSRKIRERHEEIHGEAKVGYND